MQYQGIDVEIDNRVLNDQALFKVFDDDAQILYRLIISLSASNFWQIDDEKLSRFRQKHGVGTLYVNKKEFEHLRHLQMRRHLPRI